MSYSGACRDASFNGISFRVVADAAVTIQNIEWKQERIRVYSNSYKKVTPQQCYIAGLKLAVSEAEYEILKEINDGDLSQDVKCSVTTANGSLYKGAGSFSEIGERDAMEGTCTCRFDAATKFDVFSA